uniref:Uncharacterized protein n=1 Tax=Desertifilum tharense IPPAS B-1220 TaxID=1781255 RepID=A0ACD5GYG0_9CYAN
MEYQSRGRGSAPNFNPGEQATVFILESTGEYQTVSARTVTLGQQIDDRIEIRSGLQPGERFVRRSDRPLENGEYREIKHFVRTMISSPGVVWHGN